MSYINETDFVIENKELVYPEIVTDGLQLYYDAKGKRDTDYHRDTMLDMSGNKNHGELHNFAYEKHSGYKDGLVFDYIDDKLVRPELNLQPNDFTFMLNGNIISFSPDGTVKRVQDGEVIESKGFNMVRNGDFGDGMSRWNKSTLTDVRVTKGLATVRAGKQYGGITHNLNSPSRMPLAGEKYYFCANVERESSNIHLILNDGSNQTYAVGPMIGLVSGIRTLVDNPTALIVKLQDNSDKNWTDAKISDIIVINLTETFGAGKEPTKEQMDEIINRFGFIPNAQDLIDPTEYKGNVLGDMENIIDGLYKTEILSGTEIFTDKADDSVVHVDIDGKSYQHAGSGKNLFPKEFLSDRSNFDLSTYSANNEMIKLKPDTTYTLSSERILATPSIQVVLNIQDGTNGAKRHNEEGYNADRLTLVFNRHKHPKDGGSIVKTFTTPPSGLIYFSYYDNANGQSSEGSWFTDIMINAQLEEGSTATTYEPPAPSPDYPIEIHSLNDFDVVSDVGRNLLLDSGKVRSTTRTIIVYTYESLSDYVGEDVVVSFDLMINENGVLRNIYSPYPYQNNGISIGAGIQARPTEKGVWQRFSIKTYVRDWGDNNPSLTKGAIAFHDSAGANDYKVRNIKIEKGNKATDWTPAPEEISEDTNHSLIDKTNILLSEPLRSIGNVKDRVYRNSDGLWEVERNVGEYKFTGTEGFTLFNNALTNTQTYVAYMGSNPFIKTFIDFTSNVAKNNIKTNRFLVTNSTSGDIEFMTAYSVGDNKWIWFNINRSRLSQQTVEGFKVWLSQNSTNILYNKKPTIEILSQADQDKLNNIASYKDSNYLYTIVDKTNILPSYVRDNLKPNLNAKFLYNNWYKEDRVINNLMIYNRALTNEEMLQNYKTIKRRWRM